MDPLLDRAGFAAQRAALFYPKSDDPSGSCGPLTVDPAPGVRDLLHAGCERHLGQSPALIEPLTEAGTFHALYRIRLADGRDVIGRVTTRPGPPDYALLLDDWVSRSLAGVGLPSLAIYAVDLTRDLGPWDYELLEPARGGCLRQFDADDAAMMPALTALGEFAARLHRLRAPGWGLLAPGPDGSGARGGCARWADHVVNHLDRHLAVCTQIGAVTAAEARDIARAFEDHRPLLETAPRSLLHGDLGNHNVFMAGEKVDCVIDWEDALVGDPVFEVASWATFHPERRHGAFLAGYSRARPLPADFDLRFWLYFLRIALCKTVVRHRFAITDRPGRAPASLRIQRGLAGLHSARLAA